MALLDGGLRATFGAAFGWLYLDGKLFYSERTTDAVGNVVQRQCCDPIRVQRLSCTEAMRSSGDYTDKDARFFVLQFGVRGEPDSDAEIAFGGKRWSIVSVEADSASVRWDIQAREKPEQADAVD
jgi:hypothetical protein